MGCQWAPLPSDIAFQLPVKSIEEEKRMMPGSWLPWFSLCVYCQGLTKTINPKSQELSGGVSMQLFPGSHNCFLSSPLRPRGGDCTFCEWPRGTVLSVLVFLHHGHNFVNGFLFKLSSDVLWVCWTPRDTNPHSHSAHLLEFPTEVIHETCIITSNREKVAIIGYKLHSAKYFCIIHVIWPLGRVALCSHLIVEQIEANCVRWLSQGDGSK